MRIGPGRARTLLAGFGLVLAAGSAAAASIFEFDLWMRAIDQRSQAVLLNLQRRDVPAAVADARELERLYHLMERFYEERGEHDDPLLLSWDGRQRAASTARLAEAGDLEAAFQAALGIARDCRACHDRFKPIKPLG